MARGMAFADLAFLGQVGNQLSPLSLAGLQGYWRADSFVSPNPPDGSIIGTAPDEWQDQSANNNDLIHTPAGQDPTIEYGEINGLAAVKWDTLPISESLNFSSAITLAGDFTIIFVLRDNTARDVLWVANNTINQHVRRYRAAVNNMSFFDGTTEIISSGFTTGTGSAYMFAVRRSGGTVSWRENKTARGTGVAGASITFHSVGLVFYSPQPPLSDVGEIVICNQHTSDAGLDSLYDGWFKPRWGLP